MFVGQFLHLQKRKPGRERESMADHTGSLLTSTLRLKQYNPPKQFPLAQLSKRKNIYVVNEVVTLAHMVNDWQKSKYREMRAGLSKEK